MRRQSIAIIVAVVIVVAGAEYYLQTNGSSRTGVSQVTIDITIIGGVGQGTTDRYSPANFTVHEGQQVTLAVLNTDDNTHGLRIDAFRADTGIITGGNTGRVTFTANLTGSFKYYEPAGYCKGGFGNVCNSAQHMIGNMTVIA